MKRLIILAMALLLTVGGTQAQNKKKESKNKKAQVETKSTSTKKAPADKDADKEKQVPLEPKVKLFTGMVSYNAQLLDKDAKRIDEELRFVQDEAYNKEEKLPGIEGEEMIYAFDSLNGYFEYRQIKMRYNLKDNMFIIAFKPDTSIDTYFATAHVEEAFGEKNMMFFDIFAQRLDGHVEEADHWRDEVFRNDGMQSAVNGMTAMRITYDLPEQNGAFWAFEKQEVSTCFAPFYGYNRLLADAIITFPVNNVSGRLFHIQARQLSDKFDKRLFESMTDGTEIPWSRMTKMIGDLINEWK